MLGRVSYGGAREVAERTGGVGVSVGSKAKSRRGRKAVLTLVAVLVVLVAAYLLAVMPGAKAHEALEPFE